MNAWKRKFCMVEPLRFMKCGAFILFYVFMVRWEHAVDVSWCCHASLGLSWRQKQYLAKRQQLSNWRECMCFIKFRGSIERWQEIRGEIVEEQLVQRSFGRRGKLWFIVGAFTNWSRNVSLLRFGGEGASCLCLRFMELHYCLQEHCKIHEIAGSKGFALAF